MKVIVLYSIVLIACFGQIKCGHKQSIPVADVSIRPIAVYPCEDTDTLFEVSVNLRNINDNGDKVLDVDVTLEEPIDSEYEVFVRVERWKNGAWDDNIYEGSGSLCEYLETYCETPWENLRQRVVPPVEEPCNWPAGTFELRDFHASPEDFSIPVSDFGRLKVLLKSFNGEGDVVVCYELELEVNPKG